MLNHTLEYTRPFVIMIVTFGQVQILDLLRLQEILPRAMNTTDLHRTIWILAVLYESFQHLRAGRLFADN